MRVLSVIIPRRDAFKSQNGESSTRIDTYTRKTSIWYLQLVFFSFQCLFIDLVAPSLSWITWDTQLWHARSLVSGCGMQLPDQGLNPSPLHWEHRVLSTGPQGSPCVSYFRNSNHYQFMKLFYTSKSLNILFSIFNSLNPPGNVNLSPTPIKLLLQTTYAWFNCLH